MPNGWIFALLVMGETVIISICAGEMDLFFFSFLFLTRSIHLSIGRTVQRAKQPSDLASYQHFCVNKSLINLEIFRRF